MKKTLRFIFGLFMAVIFMCEAVYAESEAKGRNKEICDFLWEMVQSGTAHMEVLGSDVSVFKRIDRFKISRDVFASHRVPYFIMKIYYDNGRNKTVLLMSQAESEGSKFYVCDFSAATMFHFLRHKDNPEEGRNFLFMDEDEYIVNSDIVSEMGNTARVCKREYFNEREEMVKSVDF